MSRKISKIDQGWQFAGPDGGEMVAVQLPHTWNATDGQDGGNDYFRGTCHYEVEFSSPVFNPDKECVYLEFDGVNATADVTLNGKDCCHHDGGYSTFRVDITSLLDPKGNKLEVAVDNSVNDHVYPQKADFTFYGGIYRDVKLVVLNKKHFEMDYWGGKGVKVTPTVKDNCSASIAFESWDNAPDAEVSIAVKDADGNTVAETTGRKAEITMDNPHLWDGLNDPYLYTAEFKLSENGEELDDVSVRFGIRSFYVDPDKGFFLNGRSYPLHGVSRHQDRKGMGNAITNKEHEEDLQMIMDVGANSIRLAHYQHNQYFYDRCDELGLVIWAEIPYISEHLPNGRENTISQMKELIIQNYHHACICFWGISNEITISTKDKKDMLDNHHELNDMVHQMDPSRITTLACYAMCGPFNKVAHITDVVAWNLYLGWYLPGFFLNDLWVGFFHLIYPKTPLAFSEYGAEGMTNLHSENPKRGDQTEEYELKYHEYMLRFFDRHPYMWANYVWNMFDFAADARDQGGEAGMNHKGLVTFDRKTKKDSFYLYKAWWSKDPFVYIAGRRMADRTGDTTKVKVITNQPHVQLYNNGKLVGEADVDKITEFKIPLEETNNLEAKAGDLTDSVVLNKVAEPNPSYVLKKEKDQQKSNWV